MVFLSLYNYIILRSHPQTRVYREALQEGEQKAKLEASPRLLALGLSVEQVAEALGLSVEEVRQAAQN